MSRWVPESEANDLVREKERATSNPAREKELATMRQMWLNGCARWPNSKPVGDHPAAPLAFCDICKACAAKEEDLASHTGCNICVAKAAAVNRVKAAGAESVEAEVAKVKKPWAMSAAAAKETGGYVVKTETKVGGGEDRRHVTTTTVVTVRLPDAHVMRFMRLRARTPLRPLSQDFFEGHDSLRENCRSGAASILCSIKLEEEVLAQFFSKGYVVVEAEVKD